MNNKKTIQQTKDFAREDLAFYSVRFRIINVENIFIRKGYNLRAFVEECDRLGFEVLQPKDSLLWKQTNLNGCLVVQEKVPTNPIICDCRVRKSTPEKPNA